MLMPASGCATFSHPMGEGHLLERGGEEEPFVHCAPFCGQRICVHPCASVIKINGGCLFQSEAFGNANLLRRPLINENDLTTPKAHTYSMR
jgi:hypothetical protein